ncbi:sortase domain-bontaining protein [Streptomyces leeuwenhoekii]|uniref:Peptidase n=1 Tax=Streptomyces leeuwenhoekii TaxID=1437453 RepID=A0A0F7W248_STRLW|nr:sortase [Streptomyces leeuwenhoekii]CQR63872.1 Peptidase [Streptomyces leeuwenhoekii]
MGSPSVTRSGEERPRGTGRLVTGVAWAVLLLGLWLWGRTTTALPVSGPLGPATGDMAAAGRPPDVRLPSAHRPLGTAPPRRLDIPGLGIQAPVAARGLDARGALDPPPPGQARTVGWYAAGPAPGAAGTALMVGRTGTGTRPAVFHEVSTLKPGDTVRVLRDGAEAAEFTVDDVRLLDRGRFDVHQAYGRRETGRAELRLITCGGTAESTAGGCAAHMVVSAYLTGTGR